MIAKIRGYFFTSSRNLNVEQPKQEIENSNFNEYEVFEKSVICDERLYFNDGKRAIDYVLVIDSTNQSAANLYLENLKQQGLQLEFEFGVALPSKVYIKIHCDEKKLKYYSNFFSIDLSMDNPYYVWPRPIRFRALHTKLTVPDPNSEVFARASETVGGTRPQTFTTAERILIVDKIISNISSGVNKIGYKPLLKEKKLEAAFPLHDGTWRWTATGPLNDRQLLFQYWAHMRNILKVQPVRTVFKYFGPELGFYFAFLEFFNKIVLIMIFIGLLLAISYAFILLYTPELNEFCKNKSSSCLLCNDLKSCPFNKIKDYCYIKFITLLVDILPSQFYGMIASVWSIIFFVFWRRYESMLKLELNVRNVKYYVTIRRDFVDKIKVKKSSPFTKKPRLVKGWVHKLQDNLMWIFTYLIMIFAVVINIALAMFIRQLLFTVFNYSVQSVIYVNIISAIINYTILKLIAIPSFIWFAYLVTKFEHHRSLEEFERSVTYKICVMAIPTYISLIVYLAVFKGRFYKQPNDAHQQYEYIAITAEICNPTGCTLDVTIHVAVIMTLDLLFSFVNILLRDTTKYMFSKHMLRSWGLKDLRDIVLRYEKDFVKFSIKKRYINSVYVNLLLQYVMVAYFTTVFPLAPFFAFIRNLIQIRLDAYVCLLHSRRIIPKRVSGVPAWNKVLLFVTFTGFLVNGAVIAFNTSFVRTFIYLVRGNDLKLFRETLLLEFKTAQYNSSLFKFDKSSMPSTCVYRGVMFLDYMYDPTDVRSGYWANYATQVLIVVIFENCLLLVMTIFYFAFQTEPQEVRDRLEEEEIIMWDEKREKLRDTFDKEREKIVFVTLPNT